MGREGGYLGGEQGPSEGNVASNGTSQGGGTSGTRKRHWRENAGAKGAELKPEKQRLQVAECRQIVSRYKRPRLGAT